MYFRRTCGPRERPKGCSAARGCTGGKVLDGAITAFAEKVDELEFSHLLDQPYYLGFVGFLAACKQLIVACCEEGLIPDLVDSPKGLGCDAWYGASRIMRAWSKGR